MKNFPCRLAAAAAMSQLLVLAPALALAAAPAGRYTASGGVVKDNRTGLYWQQAAPLTTYSLANAMTYCSGNAAGLPGTGWRLPAIKELQTLVDDSIASPGPTVDSGAFPATPASVFWSTTPRDSSASVVWIVFFDDGNSSVTEVTSVAYARCVR